MTARWKHPIGVMVAAIAAAAVVPVSNTAATAPPACSAANFTVTALHGPTFYIDSANSPRLLGAYAGYRVTDTSGAARSDVWVKLANFTGGSVSLGSGQASAQQIATMTAGGNAARFFYLKAGYTDPVANATAQQHEVQLWQGRPDLPGSTQLCTDSGGFSDVQETIKAAANKLTSVTVSGGTPMLGRTFTVTVNGSTGTVGSGTTADPQSFWMSASAAGDWPANAYRLVGTDLVFSDDPSTHHTDTLRLANLTSPNRDYTATYTFRAIGFTASGTQVLPVQQIASGTQIKHTDLGSLASLPAITPVTNNLTAALTADVTALPTGGGDVKYTATYTNSPGALLDTVDVTVPSGGSLVTGSAKWNGSGIGDGVLKDGVLVFQGPYALTGTPNTLTFTLNLTTPGTNTTSVVGMVGEQKVDTTLSLTDNQPATQAVNVNRAPDAVDDTVTVATGASTDINVKSNDSDADGDTLTLSVSTTPSHGSVSVVSGKLRYTPTVGYTGSDSLTYQLSDGRGGSDTATVNLTVAAPTTAIVATQDAASVAANGSVDIDVLGNDTGDGSLSIQDPGSPSHGSVSVVGGKIRYTPTAGWSGTDTFTYTLVDGVSRTATAQVSVTVASAAPGDDTATVAWNGDVLVSVLANDPSGASLSGVATQPAHGTATVEGNAIRYTPNGTYAGADSFTYRIAGSTVPATVNVNVTSPAAPRAEDNTATVAGSGAAEIDVLGNDAGSGLRVTGVTQPAHGTVTIEGGKVIYTPSAGYAGDDSFTYTVTDAVGATSTATARVTVRNSSPELSALKPRTITAGEDDTVTLVGTDADGDTLTYTVGDPTGPGGADGWSATVRGNRLVIKVPADASGRFTIPVTVSDGRGGTDSADLVITVNPQAPGDGEATIAPSERAVASLAQPRLVRGRPRSRVLESQLDTVVGWDGSPNRSVVRYRVLLDGDTACTVPANQTDERFSCRLPDMVLRSGADVRVVAVGAGGTQSAKTRLPVNSVGATAGPLVAVVYFASADSNLDREARTVLSRVTVLARRYGLRDVTLAGHTDWDNTDAYNLALSVRRATSVRDYMRVRHPDMVSISTGFGESRPVMSNTTAAGKAVNRRVEVYLR